MARNMRFVSFYKNVTDRQTDTASNRDARTHLKIFLHYSGYEILILGLGSETDLIEDPDIYTVLAAVGGTQQFSVRLGGRCGIKQW